MGANEYKDNEKKAFEKPGVMSKWEREVCAGLQILEVEAKPAVGDGREEIGAAGSLWRGFFEITEGPIRWLNYSGYVGLYGTGWWSTQYGVPDARLNWNSPGVNMNTVRVKKFPLLGKVVDMYWKGKDFGLGILSRLNSDISIKHTIMRAHNIEIHAYGYGCWIINAHKDEVPTAELWNCYQAIAQHLLAEWSLK